MSLAEKVRSQNQSEWVRSQGVMFLENAGSKESITTYSIVCAMVKRLYTTHIRDGHQSIFRGISIPTNYVWIPLIWDGWWMTMNHIPSGKLTVCELDWSTIFKKGKSTISIRAMFKFANCECHYQRVYCTILSWDISWAKKGAVISPNDHHIVGLCLTLHYWLRLHGCSEVLNTM